MENKSSLGKTILFTILILIGIFLILASTILIFFPKVAGNFCYDLGWNALSTKLYLNDYKSSNDINSVMKAIDISIEDNNYSNIIISYEQAIQNTKYTEFINLKNTNNYNNQNINVIAKSSLINEENYYLNKYVLSLTKTNKFSKALELSLTELKSAFTMDLDYKNIRNYSINTLIKDNYLNIDFTKNIEILETSILTCLDNYYDKLFNEYQNLNLQNNLDIVHFINFCNRILTVSNDIININANITQNIITETKIQEIQNNKTTINNKILEVI